MTSDKPEYDEREKAALEALVEPRPLSETRIAATLQRARRDIGFLRRHRGILVKMAAATMVVLLASAGFWHWSGINSDRDLGLAQGIEVLRHPDDYPFETRQAAMGRLFRMTRDTLTQMEKTGDLTESMQEQLRNCFRRPPAPLERYNGPFESIAAKVGRQPLNEEDQREMVRGLAAAIAAISSLKLFSDEHIEVVELLEGRLQKQLAR